MAVIKKRYRLCNDEESFLSLNCKIPQSGKKCELPGTAKIKNKGSGQVMPYFLIMMVVLIISWAMLLNIAKLLRDRMVMQNAADNAAISVAVYKARVLNTLGKMNYLIACALYGGENGLLSYHEYAALVTPTGWPAGLPLPAYPMGGFTPDYDPPGSGAPDSQKKVTGLLDASGVWGDTTQVSIVRKSVKSIVSLQNTLMAPFDKKGVFLSILASEIARRQEKNSSGAFVACDFAVVNKGYELGLLRNRNGIEYNRSKKLESIEAFLAKKAITFVLNAINIPVEVKEVFKSESWAQDRDSWLYADRESFARNQKVVVTAFKKSSSESSNGYPIFGSWLGISNPFYTTNAAAGLYNTGYKAKGKDTGGSMFPLEKNGQPSNKISRVIIDYKRAEKGGWDAHLVPIGGIFKH